MRHTFSDGDVESAVQPALRGLAHDAVA